LLLLLWILLTCVSCPHFCFGRERRRRSRYIYLWELGRKLALCCSRQLSGVDRTSFPKFPLPGNLSSQSPLDLARCQGPHTSFMCQKETVMCFFWFYVLVLKSWDPEF
jgi:hypothetical protein